MSVVKLTQEEDEATKYCEDFCPIYNAITEYNATHYPIICCPTEMCRTIENAYILYLRERGEVNE